MTRKILFATLLVACSTLCAQPRFEFHGFVNPHFYADSRQVVGGREEMMLFYPKPQLFSEGLTGYDVNDGWTMNLLSITARLNLAVHGPDILGAKTLAFVEGDFTGSTNASNNDLRLRHAYIRFDWEHGSLLGGQYWHPMVVHEIMPNTRPLNMGAPFHPYARYNQLRYTYSRNHFEAVGVALFQQDNMSQGLLNDQVASSTHFQRRSALPELHLQIRYNGQRLFFGAAANMLTLQPHVYTKRPSTSHLGVDWLSGVDFKPIEPSNFSSFSYSLFLKYRMPQWTLSVQTLLNNSLYEVCSMGGYVSEVRLDNSAGAVPVLQAAYRPWHFNTVWLDFGRTSGSWRPGIFVGYGRNMEANDESATFESPGPTLDVTFLGRGRDIEYLWRVAPRLGWHANTSFSFYAEAEYTYVHYLAVEHSMSTPSVYWYAHNPAGGIGNLRLMLSAEYRW